MGLIVVQLHVQYTEQPRWPFDWDCAHCCSAMLYCFVYRSVWQSLESLGTIPVTCGSLLILSKQLTNKQILIVMSFYE